MYKISLWATFFLLLFGAFQPALGKGGVELDPHFRLQYMRDLHVKYRDGVTDDAAMSREIEAALSHAVLRGDSLVWENDYFIAQSLEQFEFAAYFAAVAETYSKKGNQGRSDYFHTIAMKFFNPAKVNVGPKTGGVSAPSVRCGPMRARFQNCRWFTSRGLSINLDHGGIVLNQHLHALNSMFSLAIALDRNNRDNTEVMGKIVEGLYQLAYATGKTNVNVNTFLQPKVRGISRGRNPVAYNTAYYWVDNGIAQDISHSRTCHYQTFSLQVFYAINNVMKNFNGRLSKYPQLWQVKAALNVLKKPDGAFAEWFKAEAYYIKVRREGCPASDLTEEAKDWYRTL